MDDLDLVVSIEAEMARFEQNMESAGRIVETVTEKMDRGAKRARDQFFRLEASLDPTARAAQQLERGTNKVNLALQRGEISAGRAAKVQKQLNDQFERGVDKVNGFNQASTRGMGSTRSLGNAIQQAGFQVGDFSVQMASGQGFLRPFIQQGTQLVSMFGPMGAVIGAVGATVGAFATALLTSSDAADETTTSYDILTEAISEYNTEVEKATNLSEERTASLLKTAEALNIQSRAEVTSIESSISAQQNRLAQLQRDLEVTEALGGEGGSGLFSAGSNLRSKIEELEGSAEKILEFRKLLADGLVGDLPGQTPFGDLEEGIGSILALEHRLSVLSGQLDVSETDLGDFKDGLEDFATGAKSATGKIEDQIEANAKLAAALRVSDKEYETVKETLKILATKGFEAGEEAARSYAQELISGRGLITALQRTRKEAEKAEEKHEKLVDALNDEVAQNDRLIDALRTSEEEYGLVTETLELLGKGFQGTEEEARKFAESLIEQEETLQDIQEAYDETAKAAEDAAKEAARVWERAGDSISDAFSDALFEGENLFEGLTSAAKRAAGEIASALVIRPVINGVLGGGGVSVPGFGGGQIGGGGGFDLSSVGNLFSGGGFSDLLFNSGVGNFGVDIAQFIGGGAGTQAAFGNAFARGGSIGGLAGGFAGNFLADSLLGDRGVGASIGGSIGAIAGSFIPIPILGTAIGSFLGNAVGGLFGNRTPSVGPVIGASFGAGGASNSGVTNGGDPAAAAEFGQAVTETLKQILDATGGDLASAFTIERSQRQGFTANGESGVQHIFGDDLVGAVQFGLVGNIAGANDNNALAALYNTAATGQDFETLSGDLQLASFITSLQKANDNISPLQEAIDGVTDAYAEQIYKAIDLGLSTAELSAQHVKEVRALRDAAAARAEAFDDNTRLRELSLTGDNRQALALQLDLNRQAEHDAAQELFDAQVITADAFIRFSTLLNDEVRQSLSNFDTALRTSAEATALQGVLGAATSIDDFLFNQSIGDNSTLTGIERIAVAQDRFDGLLADVSGGDLSSVDSLLDVAQSLTTIGRDQFASSEPFANLNNSIITSLQNLQATVTSEENVGQLIAKSTEALNQSQEERNQLLVDELAQVKQEIVQLNNRLNAA